MIRINLEVNDPTRSDGPKLLALAALFTQLAQGSTAEQARAQLDEKVAGRSERVIGASAALAAPYTGPALAPADNPATGMPTPAEAFGGHGSVELDQDAAKLEALAGAGAAGPTASDLALPDPAAVFAGAAPNVPPPAAAPDASSVTPSGTPSAPNSGAQTGGAPIPASAPGVDLDSEGVPWDASVHASSKTKIANGTWKVKRGTPDLYLKERKEQLRAAVAVGQSAGNAGAAATPPANVLPPPAGAGAPIPPPPASSPGNVPAPIPTPQASAQTTPAAAGSNTVTLAQVLPRVTAAIGAGTLTADSAAAIVRELSGGKIDNVAMLAVAPALIPAFVARLDALGIPA